jgi:putative colanic acid biosysnthesis UDP-glucose lipid carrier transferase
LSSLLRACTHRRTPLAIVAPAAVSQRLAARIAAKTSAAYEPLLVFDASLGHDTLIDDVPVVHQFESFTQLVRAYRVKELWMVEPPQQTISVEALIEAFRHDFINIRIVPDLSDRALPEPALDDCHGMPVLNLVATPERGLRAWPKEIFDRLFALAVLVALAPLFAVIAVAVKCSSPGPVLFRQYRKGVDGQVFSIFKFRTMHVAADQPGTVVQARKGDPRVTRVGALLRSTSLDELPQFLNVLRGEMSVVGPRPHAIEHDDYYKDLVQNYMYRYRIKPGITGWAQVNGYRGETELIEKMAARVRFDMYYIHHWTLWLDLKIVCLTILKGFVGASAY